MNQAPQDFVRVPAAQLLALAAACLKAAGMRSDHADQLAHLLTNGDLRGVRSHGTRQLHGYCPMLREKQVNPNPELSVLQETDTAVLVSGDGGLGYAPMMLATEKAVEKAQQKGVAVGASCHHGHYGSAGHYVRRAMAAGCIAFSVQGHTLQFGEPHPDPAQRPPAAYWGNPPLCFGMPTEEEPPFILDMATCLFDQRGPEIDDLQELIPATFFKSIGFTGVSQALGGVFVGQQEEAAAAVAQKWPSAGGGGMVVVLDMGLFAGAAGVRQGVDTMARGVRQTMAPVRGYDEANLPGAPEFRKEQEYSRDGVILGLEDAEKLRQTAAEFAVEVPQALG
ncbi:MAG: hypothetical protein GKR89_34160 [Candidatus Latescibacteria bacterium]|nr:hypothetical protein [Candidatus Latescibacterota bacterium]